MISAAGTSYLISTGTTSINKPPPGPTLASSSLHSKVKSSPCVMSRDKPSSDKSSSNCAKPNVSDLHDCSMCLTAYVQSLNTVCGSASRLAQCLSGLGYQHGFSDLSVLRDACEGWDGLTRAMCTASASLKSHMHQMLQETNKLYASTVDDKTDQVTRKLHMEKLVSSLLSNFLSLQCQFSAAVLETFGSFNPVLLPLTPPSSIDQSPSLSSQYSTPATPPHFMAQLVLPGSLGGFAFSGLKSRSSSLSVSHPPQNLQPPGRGGGVPRRWSMGASSSSCTNSNPSSGMGSCLAISAVHKLEKRASGPGPPRRWSVPETTNDPPPPPATALPASDDRQNTQPKTGDALQFDTGGGAGNNGKLNVPFVAPVSSRESSTGGSRSNSHSRSATPDPAKLSAALISFDEFEEVIDVINNNHSSGGCCPYSSNLRGPRGSKDSGISSNGGSSSAVASSQLPIITKTVASPEQTRASLSKTGHAKPETLILDDGKDEVSRCESGVKVSEAENSGSENQENVSPLNVEVPSLFVEENNVGAGSLVAHKPYCRHHSYVHQVHMCTSRRSCAGKCKSSKSEAESDSAKFNPTDNISRGSSPGANFSSKTTAGGSGNSGTSDHNRGQTQRLNGPFTRSSLHHSAFGNFNFQKHYPLQLQQYLYHQQQLQANPYFKLSPISSSILTQQHHYLPFIQQQLFQKQQQMQLKQLKLNQSLQFLHLQQQQQQRFQAKKDSLPILPSHLQELSTGGGNNLSSTNIYFNDNALAPVSGPDESLLHAATSASGSCRGSTNVIGLNTSGLCSNVIPEATPESTPDRHESKSTVNSSRLNAGLDYADLRRLSDASVLFAAGSPSLLLNEANQSASSESSSKPVLAVPQQTFGSSYLQSADSVVTSTPLWPPSGTAPGVTLTECPEELRQPTSHAFQHLGGGWNIDRDGGFCSSALAESRDSPSRASWPSGHALFFEDYSRSGSSVSGSSVSPNMNQMKQGAQYPLSSTKQLGAHITRRHSDTSSFTPYQWQHQQLQYLLQQQLAPAAQQQLFTQQLALAGGGGVEQFAQPPQKLMEAPLPSSVRHTRSSDNLHIASDSTEQAIPLPVDGSFTLEQLLTLNSDAGCWLPNSSPPSPTIRYSSSLYSQRN